MWSLEGQQPMKSQLAQGSRTRVWRCRDPRGGASGRAQAQPTLWVKTFPRCSRRTFKSAAPLRMSFLSCSWREGPGQQHGTGSKGGKRPFRFAILTRNLCSQFVVSPAASLPARNLPGGPVANPILHTRKSHPCETPEQRRAVSLRCFTKTQVLPKQQLWLSLVVSKAVRLLKPDPVFVNLYVLSHRTRSSSKLSLMYWHTHRTISSTQHRSPKRCSHDHL